MVSWALTNPHSCCSPWSKQAIASALRFLLTPTNSSTRSSQLAAPSPRLLVRSLRASISSRTSISIPLTVMSTSLFPPCPPSTRSTTLLASPDLPAFTSHLGVSGMTTMTAACTTAGKPPMPTIHLHAVRSSPYSLSTQPTT